MDAKRTAFYVCDLDELNIKVLSISETIATVVRILNYTYGRNAKNWCPWHSCVDQLGNVPVTDVVTERVVVFAPDDTATQIHLPEHAHKITPLCGQNGSVIVVIIDHSHLLAM